MINNTNYFFRFVFLLLITWIHPYHAASQPVLQPAVIAEEQVYAFEEMNNGSGPMWCRGNTCIVRIGDNLYASGLETLPDAKPLNNCVPLLFAKMNDAWELVYRGDERTREPGPITRFEDGRIFYSTNPTITEPDVYSGPTQPAVLEFSSVHIKQQPIKHLPKWNGNPEFSEHSYRTFVADAANSEMFLMQNIMYDHAEWSFFDNEGQWSAQGKLKWPFEEKYDTPQPVRLCYPAVALQDKKVFFAGVSDIQEPYEKWSEFKYKLTGQKWDYDFRRLFFTWSDDITTGDFHPWVEIASRDETAGWITPWDMFVQDDDSVFVIWTERAIDERLRETFFPDAKQRHSLELAIIKDGEVIKRTTIMEQHEGENKLVPSGARLHVSEDHRLFVIYYVSGTLDGKPLSSNFISEIHKDGSFGEPKEVKFEIPFTNFFTNTIRAGNEPSNVIDLFGQHGNTMRYGCVKLF